VVALDAATGRVIWKTYTIPDPPRPTKKNKIGTQLWGPSGAPIWSSPAIGEKRHALYVTTGDNYSEPNTRLSDAFIAFDLDTGKILWSRQMTESDAYVAACRLPDKTNCPSVSGPDFDFGSSPILVNLPNGKRALIAGQKSGIVHAIDPDQQGKVLWQVRVGKGGTMGGVQWGSAVDGSNVYVAVSDIGRIMLTYSTQTNADPKQGGGMFALRLSDGQRSGTHHPQLRYPAALQPRTIGGGYGHSRRGLLRLGRRPPPRLFHRRWQSDLGLRYRPRLCHRKSRQWSRRLHRWPGSRNRGWHAFCQFRLRHRRRYARHVLLAFSVDGK